MLRALVVDDEEPARERLRLLLTEAGDVQIVGEAGDGEQAMEQIAALSPDVVFLDIQMPGCGGLEVAASLAVPRPAIIFCTAFDEFAVDAFELNAVDYLLKPINRARLEKALARVRTTVSSPTGTAISEVREHAIDRVARGNGAPSRFLAKRGASYRVVPAGDVLCFVSEGGLTKLIAHGQHYWMQPTLNDLEVRLDPMRFFRISRAAIVNLDAVREVVPGAGGQGLVVLSDGARLEVSRRRYGELTSRLGHL
jgi:two-component system LytT family response regulator